MATKKDRERAASKRTSARDWANQQQRGGDATCIKLPDGVDFYKLEVGTHKVDFLPYTVGKNNPRADEGMEHFERSYEAHRVATPDGSRWYACRKSCFGKRCAICDWLTRYGGTADQELVKSLRAKSRHLWIVNTKPGDTKKPEIKVLDTGHFNRGMGFGELMVDAINSLDEGVDPFVLEGGYTAILTVKEQTMPGNKFNAVTRIDLRPHSYDYPERLLETMPCLDDLLVDVGYDEVMRLLDPESVADDKEDEEKLPKKTVKDDDDDDEPAKKPAKGKADDDDDDDDDDDTPPSKPASKSAKTPTKADADDDDDDDETPTKGKTAKDLGLKVGDVVKHPKHGECEIVKISGDGTSIRLEDEDGDIFNAIDPATVKKVAVADEDDDSDDDDEDDDTPPSKPAKKPTKADDDDDDDSDEDDEPAKKPTRGKR